MKKFNNHVKKMEAYYRTLHARNVRLKGNKIDGHLIINKKKDHLEFVHCLKTPNGKVVKYLGTKPDKLATRLAEQYYHERAEKFLSRRIKVYESMRKELELGSLDDIYEAMSPERQSLITPLAPTRAQRMEAWKSRKYQGKGFRADDKSNIKTNKGERVRSKTEKILADLFNSMGLEYKYECPLSFSKNITYYPDFTFYDPDANVEIYWEHFGMMDDPNYVNNFLTKIDTYRAHGIHLGERLIVTFETKDRSLDYDQVKALIHKHLL